MKLKYFKYKVYLKGEKPRFDARRKAALVVGEEKLRVAEAKALQEEDGTWCAHNELDFFQNSGYVQVIALEGESEN